jgi:hypothetical protein
MTKILKCNCVQEFQDETYGQNMRVHNKTAKDDTWRCCVCNTERKKGDRIEVTVTKKK